MADHSRLSRRRTRLPHEVHAAVFDWVLALIAEADLVKGARIGVDASTMETPDHEDWRGTTHLAYKPEHAVDLDTGAVVAAELHPAA